MTPLFGFLKDAEDALTELVTNLFLVAGGFLVGYLLGGVVAWAVARYALRQKNGTQNFKAVGKPVGGAILALIVALIVFTGKGKGPGDGGSGKDGNPNSDPNAGKSAPVSPDPKLKLDPAAPKTPEVKPADAVIRVTVYGGTVVSGDEFYQLDDAPQRVNLGSLKTAIQQRKATAAGKLSVAILYPANKEHAPGNLPGGGLHKNVSDVVHWVNNEAKLDVTFPAGM